MIRPTLRILLVDDDADYHFLFQKILESYPHAPFELTAVSDYKTALKAATTNGYDVCLVDFYLSDKNGLDLLKECRRRECDLPFILLTGYSDPDIDQKALESGAADYLEKYRLDAPILERAIRYAVERHQASLALRHSEEHFRALIENTMEVVVVMDAKALVLYVSPSIERILGYKPEERLGHVLYDIWHPDDLSTIQELLKQILAIPGTVVTRTVRVRHKNGTYRWIEGSGMNLLNDPAVQGIVLNYRDVTERKETQERLLRYERLAALGEIAAGLAHEIRNPLATMSSTVQYLKTKVLDPKCVSDLDNILIQSDRIKQLVNETLDYSKKPSLRFEVVHLKEILMHSLSLAQIQFGPDHAKTRVILEIPESLPEIWADRPHIEQVLVNLILNAYQAVTSEGGHIVLNCVIIEDEIILKVQDDGPGIRDEDLPRIFDPFFTTKKRGSGLGLSISQRVAREHGGRIEVECLRPKGTAFVLKLPVYKENHS